MLLLDVTGSMNYGTSERDQTPRKDTVREAISLIVKKLGEEDSQAAHEEHGGGLRTVTFAGGKATDLEDINPHNLKEKWSQIKWAGSTKIMPGWNKIHQVYDEEFGSRPPKDRPLLMLLIITDGEAEDSNQFAATLAKMNTTGKRVYVTLAIIGYGPDFDEAVKTYSNIQKSLSFCLRVLPFDSELNPEIIAASLLTMVE